VKELRDIPEPSIDEQQLEEMNELVLEVLTKKAPQKGAVTPYA